jgi:hypothetical protein
LSILLYDGLSIPVRTRDPIQETPTSRTSAREWYAVLLDNRAERIAGRNGNLLADKMVRRAFRIKNRIAKQFDIRGEEGPICRYFDRSTGPS